MVELNEITAKVPEQRVGWLETKLPKTVMTRLQSYIETAKNNPVSHNKDLNIIISKAMREDLLLFNSIVEDLLKQEKENPVSTPIKVSAKIINF